MGALGSHITFGFLGPTLLAVGYNIIRDWTKVESGIIDPASGSRPS
jgi:hypothetical protein